MKMQSVQFTSFDEFWAYLPEDERMVSEILHQLITEVIPETKVKLSFNVPYYRRKKTICFIWPASITWGAKKTYEGVRLGFVRGYLMTDYAQILAKGNRKQVYWIDYRSLSEIDPTILRSYLLEALYLDDESSPATQKA